MEEEEGINEENDGRELPNFRGRTKSDEDEEKGGGAEHGVVGWWWWWWTDGVEEEEETNFPENGQHSTVDGNPAADLLSEIILEAKGHCSRNFFLFLGA